jgi:hypothetical protein
MLGSGKGSKRPSDEVEGLRFEVVWEPQKGALGIVVDPEDIKVEEGELAVVSACSVRLQFCCFAGALLPVISVLKEILMGFFLLLLGSR